MSERSYCHWRCEYACPKVTQPARLQVLGKGNARLRPAVSHLTLDALILKEVIGGKY